MSTHPVLLGRVTGAAGLNVGVGDTPKPDGQSAQPGHVDIEASPSPTVTRVNHEDIEGRPSWTWRYFQSFIALLVVIFATWLAIALGSDQSWDTPSYEPVWDDNGTEWKFEVPALKDDPRFIALMCTSLPRLHTPSWHHAFCA